MDDTQEAGAPSSGVPVCPSCGRPTDDIEAMDEATLLEAIHIGVLRDLARSVRGGDAGHQELAIARGILRDNKKIVPPSEDDTDDQLPEQGATALPRKFPRYEHDE